MATGSKANAPRTEKVLPGVWRLRLPLPWPGVPHGNAWAIEAADGIVLFDTGMGGKGRLRQLDLALAQAGFGVEDVGLLVCTHSHVDHYGLAARSSRRPAASSGCTPPGSTCGCSPTTRRRRSSTGSRSPARAASRSPRWSATARRAASDVETGIDAIQVPDRELVPGVEVETDLGTWQVTRRPATLPRTSSCTSPSAS